MGAALRRAQVAPDGKVVPVGVTGTQCVQPCYIGIKNRHRRSVASHTISTPLRNTSLHEKPNGSPQ
jgi:hypothetical protein